MSKSNFETKRDEQRQALDEQEVRDALIRDDSTALEDDPERHSEWIFQQLEDAAAQARLATERKASAAPSK